MVWLTARRVRLYCGLIILAYVLCWGAMIWFTSQPKVKRVCDFVSFWMAGKLVQEGKIAEVYDFDTFIIREEALLGRHIAPIVYRYPPTFLPFVSLLAHFSYEVAYGLFVFLSVLAFVTTCYAIYPHSYCPWLVLSCPILYENVSFGQNGLLNGVLFGLALYFVQKRPILAGILFGLLTYKVHLVWLVPFALIAGRHWRVLVTMVATALFLVLLSLFLYGVPAWQAFLKVSGPDAIFQPVVSFADMVTPWGAVYLMTENVRLAWLLQVPFTVGSLLLLLWTWKQEVPFSLKAATLLLLCLVATPYALVYDLSFLGLAMIFLAKDGAEAREEKYFIIAWSFVFLSSLLAAAFSLPLAQLILLSMVYITWQRVIVAGGTKS